MPTLLDVGPVGSTWDQWDEGARNQGHVVYPRLTCTCHPVIVVLYRLALRDGCGTNCS